MYMSQYFSKYSEGISQNNGENFRCFVHQSSLIGAVGTVFFHGID